MVLNCIFALTAEINKRCSHGVYAYAHIYMYNMNFHVQWSCMQPQTDKHMHITCLLHMLVHKSEYLPVDSHSAAYIRAPMLKRSVGLCQAKMKCQ
jgi:hypothetical protein